MRIGAVRRFYAVVDQDWRSIAEPEGAGAYDFVPGVESGGDCDLIAAAALDLYDLLTNTTVGFARLRILHVGHHEYGIAIRRIVDGRSRQRNHVARLADRQLDLHEH